MRRWGGLGVAAVLVLFGVSLAYLNVNQFWLFLVSQFAYPGLGTRAMPDDTNLLLSVRNLKTYFPQDEGTVKAVDGVSFDLYPGRTLGIVGESGCGKSITARSILRIVDRPGRIVEGQILFRRQKGVPVADTSAMVDLTQLAPYGDDMRAIRGAEIALIFQEPMSSFSPVHTIGNQLIEAILLHRQDAVAGVVQLVDFALAFDVGAIARRDDFSREIKAIGIAAIGFLTCIGVDHDDVRLRVVVFDGRRDVDPRPLIRRKRRSMAFERIIENALEIARDALMRERGRRHHHGDTIDELPAFLVRPAECGPEGDSPRSPSAGRVLGI